MFQGRTKGPVDCTIGQQEVFFVFVYPEEKQQACDDGGCGIAGDGDGGDGVVSWSRRGARCGNGDLGVAG